MKRVKKVFIWMFGIILCLFVSIVILFTVSVKPGVYLIQKMFDTPVEIVDKDKYEELSSAVEREKDIKYTSNFQENELDIIYKKDAKANPVLFWVHGGGYVGGDKDGVAEFATYIAAKANVVVIPINYEKAPSLQYPGQLEQLEDAYLYMEQQSDNFPMLDLDRVMFGGDSAGAQIAGQFVALQTNKDYAEVMNKEQIIDLNNIAGFISYSGPVNLQDMSKLESESLFMKFFTNTVARAFIGKRDWKDSSEIKEASLVNYITSDFPPTYITDGNTFSFSAQGKALEKVLKQQGVFVETLFFDQVNKEIPHEYQFNYELEEARDGLEETIQFLRNIS